MTNPERYIGQSCTLGIGWTGKTGTAMAEWSEYDIEITTIDREARKATSPTEQRVTTATDASMNVRGWRGGDEGFTALIDAGAAVLSIDGTDIPSTLCDAPPTGFGTWKCTRKRVSQTADPGTWEMDFKPGFLTTSAS